MSCYGSLSSCNVSCLMEVDMQTFTCLLTCWRCILEDYANKLKQVVIWSWFGIFQWRLCVFFLAVYNKPSSCSWPTVIRGDCTRVALAFLFPAYLVVWVYWFLLVLYISYSDFLYFCLAVSNEWLLSRLHLKCPILLLVKLVQSCRWVVCVCMFAGVRCYIELLVTQNVVITCDTLKRVHACMRPTLEDSVQRTEHTVPLHMDRTTYGCLCWTL